MEDIQDEHTQVAWGCDESKCVSTGKSELFGDSFTCYGEDDDDGTDAAQSLHLSHPRMCADGYLPVVIPGEVTDSSGDTSVSWSYFTCCPPGEEHEHEYNHDKHENENPAVSSSTVPLLRRHCSDPVLLEDETDSDNNRNTANVNLTKACSLAESPSTNNSNPPRIFGRLTKARMDSDSTTAVHVLCCDYELQQTETMANETTQVECVPYQNDEYEPAVAESAIGSIGIMVCDFDDDTFAYARELVLGNETSIDQSIATGQYQCCQTGPSLPPLVHDRAFAITVYPTLVLFYLAAIASGVIAIAMMIPLGQELYQKRKKRRQNLSTPPARISTYASTRASSVDASRNSADSSGRTTGRISSMVVSARETIRESVVLWWEKQSAAAGAPDDSSQRSGRSGRSGGSARRRETQFQNGPPGYSSYNVYLIYLALLDLVYTGYSIAVYQSYIDQTFDPTTTTTYAVNYQPEAVTTLDDPLVLPYTCCNLWINAIVMLQLYTLLRSSQQARRIQQPSLRKVNLQAGGVCLVFAVITIVLYFLYQDAVEVRIEDGNDDLVQNLNRYTRPILTIFGIVIPGVYVLLMAAWIWWRGLLPRAPRTSRRESSSSGAVLRQKALRQLTLYFGRIIVIFLGIWWPRGMILMFAENPDLKWLVLVAQVLLGIQPLLTTAAILTKSDVQEYTIDLLTLGHCGVGRETLGRCCRNSSGATPPAGDKTGGGGNRFSTETVSAVVPSGVEASVIDPIAEEALSDDENDKDEDDDGLIASVLGFSRDDLTPQQQHEPNNDNQEDGETSS